jgi:hypothetical protein
MNAHSVLALLIACAAISPAAQAQDSESQNAVQTPIPTPIVYRNTQYGFCFRLPADWKGYSITVRKWSGGILSTGDPPKIMQGPLIVIRHPAWTEDDPYQDIPIMVFTRAQWRVKQKYGVITSASGVDWGTFGSNTIYVFKQPDRWVGYTDDKGWREVEDLMMTDPFQAPCANSKASTVK